MVDFEFFSYGFGVIAVSYFASAPIRIVINLVKASAR